MKWLWAYSIFTVQFSFEEGIPSRSLGNDKKPALGNDKKGE
jgi:hypothetical protein